VTSQQGGRDKGRVDHHLARDERPGAPAVAPDHDRALQLALAGQFADQPVHPRLDARHHPLADVRNQLCVNGWTELEAMPTSRMPSTSNSLTAG